MRSLYWNLVAFQLATTSHKLKEEFFRHQGYFFHWLERFQFLLIFGYAWFDVAFITFQLKVGNGEDFFPRNGRWNFNNKVLILVLELLSYNRTIGSRLNLRGFCIVIQKLVDPTSISKWAVVNFSARCDIRNLVRDLIKCGGLKGIVCSFHLNILGILLVVLVNTFD